MTNAAAIAGFLDELLATPDVPDYPNALNGLQLANRGDEIRRVATAVDFSSATVSGAIAGGAQMLIVHHGMFWPGLQRIVGSVHARLRHLIEHDVAVYSSHLPLDLHADVGNNVLLARRLDLVAGSGFASTRGVDVGVRGEADESTAALAARVRRFCDELGSHLVVTPFDGARRTRRWAICTGAGASSATLAEARDLGVDTLIVGEGPHHTAVEARDENIVILYAGHYATETLGVQALGARLATRFGIETTFIHEPTGL